MHFDDILRKLGEFGTYQKRLYILLCIPMVSAGFHMVISVFLTGTPDHRCAIPGYDNDTYEVQNAYHQYIVNLTIPKSTDETKEYDQCMRYDGNTSEPDTFENATKVKCSSWVYDKTIYIATFTAQENLVCDDRLKTSHAQMIFFGGVLLGSVGLGAMSDAYGRKKVVYFSFVLLLVSTMIVPWTPNFLVFCILRFFVGVACLGMFMTSFVMGMELVGPSKRVIAGVVIEFFWAAGLVILSGVGYAFKHWKYIQITLSVPAVLLVVSMVYYGLALNSGNLVGDFYLNFFLQSFVEIPTYAICLVLLNRTGRKFLHCFTMIFGGLCCISTIFTMLYASKDLQPLTVALAMLGKIGITAAFAVIYVWSAELYPTVVRNAGMGASSSCARIGGMISPYIADLSKVIPGNFGRALPLVIFGALSVLAGVLAFMLPETKGRDLPETVEDAKQFGKDKPFTDIKIMRFDDILRHIGEFGPYQKRLYFILCIPMISSGFHAVISVFLTGTPDHRCAIPGLDNDTYAVQSDYHKYLINLTIPPSDDETKTYEQCHMYNINISDSSTFQNRDKIQCRSWVYDRTGSIGLGLLSDTIGRKKVFFLSIMLMLVSTMALPWSPNFATFCVLRFFTGMSGIGLFMTGFVIGMELVGPSKRVITGVVIEYFWAVGVIILAGIGYWLKDWFYIEIVCSVPTIIPESARWLVSKNKFDEARKIVTKAAKVNKANIPKEMLDMSSIENPPREGVWQLFTSRVLFVRSMIIFFNWYDILMCPTFAIKINFQYTVLKITCKFICCPTCSCVVSMVFYGLALNSGNLGGDFYLNFFLQGLVEIPAYTLCLVLLNITGRRILHCSTMILGGICCICTIFTMLYADKSELYPTVVRNSSMGLSSTCARVGGMVSPYIADLSKVIPGNFGRALPLVIFGGLSVLAGILAIALPETMNMNLPETMEDGRQFGKKNSKYKEEMKPEENGKTNQMKQKEEENGITNPLFTEHTLSNVTFVTPTAKNQCSSRYKQTKKSKIYFYMKLLINKTNIFIAFFVVLLYLVLLHVVKYSLLFDDIFRHLDELGPYQRRLYFLTCLPAITTGLQSIISFDDIFRHLDELGPYQRRIYLLTCMPVITTGFQSIISVFLIGMPDHRCAIPGFNNDTYAVQSDYHQYLINLTIPPSEDETKTYDQCHLYNINASDSTSVHNPNKIQCTSWVYDRMSSMALPWSQNFASFSVLRFFIGMANIGMGMTGFVIDSLLSSNDFTLIILVVESARWLVSKNRFEEARAIVYQAAKVNKNYLPEQILAMSSIENPPVEGVWQLNISQRTFDRCVVSMVFYGLALNSGNLGGDFYLNFFLQGIVEVPAYIICQLFLNVLGRRILHCSSMILGGICCICTIFTMLYADKCKFVYNNLQMQLPVTVALAMLGKVGISAAFAIIYVWSAELYPTVVRNSSMGLSSTSARIGGMLSPYIADLVSSSAKSKVVPGNFGRALPLVIFGGLSVLAGIMAIALPETMNMNLPETMEDGRQFGKKNSKYKLSKHKYMYVSSHVKTRRSYFLETVVIIF
ncbi:hypothetical protein KUTeg_008024 [Tegillarca granosa]|uniref:Uncharacterized protein n=1 Tax=Tegillarca granosa TaxID=220873 RepID=A0ABQ9FF00_TEGGR|nr:hypothetical protein KUTeg_008024 [Tegillarca granosa]